jgi:hypothetical protein
MTGVQGSEGAAGLVAEESGAPGLFRFGAALDGVIPDWRESGESLPNSVQELLTGGRGVIAETAMRVPLLFEEATSLLSRIASPSMAQSRDEITEMTMEIDNHIKLLVESDVLSATNNGINRFEPLTTACQLIREVDSNGSADDTSASHGSLVESFDIMVEMLDHIVSNSEPRTGLLTSTGDPQHPTGSAIGFIGDDVWEFSGEFLCKWNYRSLECDDNGCNVVCVALTAALTGKPGMGTCDPLVPDRSSICFCFCHLNAPVQWWRALLVALVVLAVIALIVYIISNLTLAALPRILKLIESLLSKFPELKEVLEKLIDIIKGILGGGGRVPNPT